MKITYFVEVLSSWCHWAEPTWAELQRRCAGEVEFHWKIALMRPAEFPASRTQCEWFYRRSGTLRRSPYVLNPGWFEAELAGVYDIPNLVAEAGRALGLTGDTLRLALTHAAVREGRPVGRLDEAVAVAASVGLDPQAVRALATSPAIRERVDLSTAEFHRLGFVQRPAFLLENSIGDRAQFSGLVQLEPLLATLQAMQDDARGYSSFAAHFGPPPPA